MELRNQELDGIAKRAKLGLSIKTQGREAREAAEVAKVAEAVEAVKVAGDSPLGSVAVALAASSSPPPATSRPTAQPASGATPSARRVVMGSNRTGAATTPSVGKRGEQTAGRRKLASSPGLAAIKAARGARAE